MNLIHIHINMQIYLLELWFHRVKYERFWSNITNITPLTEKKHWKKSLLFEETNINILTIVTHGRVREIKIAFLFSISARQFAFLH